MHTIRRISLSNRGNGVNSSQNVRLSPRRPRPAAPHAMVPLGDYGCSFSPFASMATYFSIRRARVSAFLASWTRYRIA